MRTYTLAQAKDNLADMVDAALAGEAVAIARNGQPVIRLVPSNEIAAPMTRAEIAVMASQRLGRPRLARNSVELVREMRDEKT